MIDLLSKRDQRIVRILDYLVDIRKTSLQALSKGSNVPERTLWGDIKRINEMCAPAIIVSTSEGVALEIPSEYNERYMFDKIMQESIELQALEAIYLQHVWSIQDLASLFYLSDITIRRMIQGMNRVFNPMGIEIKSNPLEIKGDTPAIIQFFTQYFLEKYNRVNLFMNPQEIEAVELLLRSIDLTEQLIRDNQDFNLLVLRFFVRLKFYIGAPQDTIDEDASTYVNNFEQVNQRFRSAFGIKLTPSIVHFCIPYLFEATSTAMNVNDLVALIQTDADTKIYEQITQFLNRFIETSGMSFTNYDELVVSLFDIIKEATQFPFIVYDRDKHFVTHLEIFHPLLVKQVIALFSEVFEEEKYQPVLYSVLYVFLTHWEGLITIFKNREQEISVAIFFDSDIEHARLAKEVLEHEFGDVIYFEVLDVRTYEDLDAYLPDFDILITNKPGIQFEGCDVLCLDEFFLDDSWSELRAKLVQKESEILSL